MDENSQGSWPYLIVFQLAEVPLNEFDCKILMNFFFGLGRAALFNIVSPKWEEIFFKKLLYSDDPDVKELCYLICNTQLLLGYSGIN